MTSAAASSFIRLSLRREAGEEKEETEIEGRAIAAAWTATTERVRRWDAAAFGAGKAGWERGRVRGGARGRQRWR
jgi:hypothetical protein